LRIERNIGISVFIFAIVLFSGWAEVAIAHVKY